MGRVTEYDLSPLTQPLSSMVVGGSDNLIFGAAHALVSMAEAEGRRQRYVIEDSSGVARAYTANEVLRAYSPLSNLRVLSSSSSKGASTSRAVSATNATRCDGAQIPGAIGDANTASDRWAEAAHRSAKRGWSVYRQIAVSASK